MTTCSMGVAVCAIPVPDNEDRKRAAAKAAFLGTLFPTAAKGGCLSGVTAAVVLCDRWIRAQGTCHHDLGVAAFTGCVLRGDHGGGGRIFLDPVNQGIEDSVFRATSRGDAELSEGG